ncbi:hypothetical protein [Paraburkholderia aromaticivorans]|uniref:hypothetical protein n=1 Tax=Paraburkholderia aromaticivorans TaxID=2026199 RepID=UPI0038BD3D1A
MKKLFLIFTALYLFCEVTYNLGLVEFLASKNTTIDVYQNLENFGKALSAIGLSLILIKAIPKRFKALALAAFIPLLFVTETVAFNTLLDRLPAQAKVYGYFEGVYRNAVINGNIEDSRFPVNLGAGQKVALASIVTLNREQIPAKVNDFLFSKLADDTVDGLFTNYDKLTSKIEPYYAVYAVESKKYADAPTLIKQRYLKAFEEKTHGIEPGLSQADFTNALAKRSPSYQQYANTVIIPGNAKLGITELRAGAIPLGMNREQFHAWVSGKYEEVLSHSRVTEANIDKLPHSRDLVASVFIPPIAIALSLLSIILNATSLLAGIYRPLAIVPLALVATAAVTAPASLYGVPDWQNRAMAVESDLMTTLDPYVSVIHRAFINDQHPDTANIIRIEKPKAVDFSDIEKSMQSLQQQDDTDLPKVDERLQVDTSRLNEPGYFGQIKTSKNPYTN